MACAKPCQERYVDRRQDGVGGAEEPKGPLGVTGRVGEERRRLEHEHAKPAVAELDEERQRLLELRCRRLGVAEVRVDLRNFPEHLAEGPTVARSAQDVEAFLGPRSSRRRERPAGTCDSESVERCRDAVRVAEPAEHLETALEERAGEVVLSGDDEVQREPVERSRDSLLVAEPLVARRVPRGRASRRPDSPHASGARGPARCTPVPPPSSHRANGRARAPPGRAPRLGRSRPGNARGHRSRSATRARAGDASADEASAVVEPAPSLAQVATLEPEAPEHGAELQGSRRVLLDEREAQRGAEVVVVGLERRSPPRLVGGGEARRGRLGEPADSELRVPCGCPLPPAPDSSSSPAYSRIVSSIPKRSPSTRTRLLSTSEPRASRSTLHTSSTAARVQPPTKTERRRKSAVSSSSRRSTLQAIVSRSARCLRGRISRPRGEELEAALHPGDASSSGTAA